MTTGQPYGKRPTSYCVQCGRSVFRTEEPDLCSACLIENIGADIKERAVRRTKRETRELGKPKKPRPRASLDLREVYPARKAAEAERLDRVRAGDTQEDDLASLVTGVLLLLAVLSYFWSTFSFWDLVAGLL